MAGLQKSQEDLLESTFSLACNSPVAISRLVAGKVVGAAANEHEHNHAGGVDQRSEGNPSGHTTCRWLALENEQTGDDNANAHDQNATECSHQIGIVGGQTELCLQILGQERVESRNGQQMEHARGSAEHEYIVAQLTTHRLGEV